MSDPSPTEKPELRLPHDGKAESLRSNVVVVGANGSGKSRLGVWVEENSKNTHRISAQRALTFAAIPQLKEQLAAERLLRWGHETLQSPQARLPHRWGSNPTNYVLNDFDALLATLFARQRARDHHHSAEVERVRSESDRPTVDRELLQCPDCETDQIARLWAELFPHRGLTFDSDRVLAQVPGGQPYEGPAMSDGERVALYLAGQVLCAQEQTILILDEPEIHLHRAILAPLWDALEQMRPGCLFLYLTHDVHFAATRASCTKVWLRSSDGQSLWEWDEVSRTEGMPEELLLSVLGSRRPCLFVEGERGSLDFELISLAYPDHYVVPRGSCEKVIETTKAFLGYPEAHRVAAEGIIDRDRRSDEETHALRERGIRVLPVAEIENLLLTEAVVRFVAQHQRLDPEVILRDVRAFVRSRLEGELETQIEDRAIECARLALSRATAVRREGEQGFVDSLEGLKREVDPAALWRESAQAFREALAADDYPAILRLYNRKSLVKEVAACFKLSGDGYVGLCLGLARPDDDTGRRLRAILRAEIERES